MNPMVMVFEVTPGTLDAALAVVDMPVMPAMSAAATAPTRNGLTLMGPPVMCVRVTRIL